MKPISISLAPNNERDDVYLALKLIFQPWKWKNGKAIVELEQKIKEYIGVKYAFSFNSGRTSLMAILSAFDSKEVLLQAFTCNAASNPIIWSGKKPIYVDCSEDTFNIDISDLRRKIGPNSKVLMVQHTFGLPADMDAVMGLNLDVIEDCAHALGAEYKGRKVGTFGKAAFFSFGRDKIISSVWGGMTVTNDDEVAIKIKEFRDKISFPGYFWTLQQLLHPVLMQYIVLPLYNVLDLGKIFLVLSQWLGILSKAVSLKEKKGKQPSHFPTRMPNALAILALKQFNKLDRFYNHRKQLAEFYADCLKNTSFKLPQGYSWLRYTVIHPKAHEIIYKAWHKENILIGDWYTSPVIPSDTELESVGYKLGSCPTAERLAKTTLNLPTHINVSFKNAERIVKFLKNY